MVYILSWTTKKHQKILSRQLHSKLKKIQGLFEEEWNSRDFSRTSLNIQGLFQDCANPGYETTKQKINMINTPQLATRWLYRWFWKFFSGVTKSPCMLQLSWILNECNFYCVIPKNIHTLPPPQMVLPIRPPPPLPRNFHSRGIMCKPLTPLRNFLFSFSRS